MQPPVRLAPAQLEHYREHGFVALGRVLDDARGAANQTLFVNIQLCHLSEPVRRFCTAGAHLDAVRTLLGPDVCLTHQQFITKLPDDAGQRSDIPLHQDNGYGRLEPMTDVTVWVALVDTDERNGGLVVLPGSHRLGLLPHDAAGVNPLLRETRAEIAPVPVPLAAGEAVAFTGLTLHGSGPNRSGTPRPGLFVRYCEPGTVMVGEERRPVLEDPHSWMAAGEAR